MSSSVYSTIKQAIQAETTSDISIHEQSIVSLLIKHSGEGKPLTIQDFRIQSYSGKSLVITRYLILFLRNIILGFIWLIYAVYNLLHKIVTGHWRGMRPSSGINVIILATTLIAAIVILLYLLMFLIRDVVFSPNTAQVNANGAVTVEQPCHETQSFFLLNSATYWTSTGIQIMEGDRVYLTASGSMYSDIGEMTDAANENRRLLYNRSSFGPSLPNKTDTKGVQYCIYGRYHKDREKTNIAEAAHYGSLLYQICNQQTGLKEYNDENDPYAVQQANFAKFSLVDSNSLIKKLLSKILDNREFYFDAKETGTLYLSFNDILLDHAIIDSLSTYRSQNDTIAFVLWEDIVSNIPKNTLTKKHINKCNNDTAAFLKEYYIKDSTIWFQDNIGEILVNIRIVKNIWHNDLPWYKKPVIGMYRIIDHCANKPYWKYLLPLILIGITIWFAIDISVSRFLRRRKRKKDLINTILTQPTKEEFRMLVMLYAANIDGHIHADELEAMLNKVDATTLKRMRKLYKKMSDIKVLSCITENKARYVPTEGDKEQLLNDLRDVIIADKQCAPIESQLLQVIERVLS